MLCRALIAVGAAGLLLSGVALVPVRTAASWSISPTLSGAVGALAACSTPGTFAAAAQGQALAGTVLGTAVGGLAQVAPLAESATSSGTTTSTGATPQGGGLYSSSADLAGAAGALNGAAGTTVLTTASGSAWTSTVSAATTGISSASAGAVTASTGAMQASGGSSAGTLDVSAALGSGAPNGLAAIRLAMGPAAAQATLDGCRGAWGIGTPLTRSYHVGSLQLGFVDASAQTLDGALSSQNSTLSSTLSTLTGTAVASSIASSAGTGLAKAVADGLSAAGVLTPSSTVVSASATVAVPAAQTGQLVADLAEVVQDSSAIVSLDSSTSRCTVDLGALIGGLDGQAPNTQVLTAARASSAAAALQAALDLHVAHVERDWAAARDAMTVRVQATASGSSTLGQIVSSSIDVTATAAAWAGGTETQAAPTTTAVGTVSALLLSTIGVGVANAIGPDFYSRSGGVQSVIGSQVTTPAANAVSSAAASVGTARGTAAAALPGEVGGLVGAVGVVLDQQPDQAPLPAAYPGALPMSVTALRVLLTTGGAPVVDLDVANASVGPNRAFSRP